MSERQLPKTVLLHYVTVEKESREGGIGSALIRKGIESMKQAGVKTVLFREMSESAAGLLASFRFKDFFPSQYSK